MAEELGRARARIDALSAQTARAEEEAARDRKAAEEAEAAKEEALEEVRGGGSETWTSVECHGTGTATAMPSNRKTPTEDWSVRLTRRSMGTAGTAMALRSVLC